MIPQVRFYWSPLGALAALLLAGCASGGEKYNPHVDAMFRETGARTESVLTMSRPALVNEVNGAYQVNALAYVLRAALAPSGKVISGGNAVLTVEFTDLGDIGVLRTDDRDVSLRAELGPDGKVLRALLGSESGHVTEGFTSAVNDAFKEGSWRLLYDGPDIVVGRLDLKFTKYEVAVNFRALKK
jgi:hypothetical protein